MGINLYLCIYYNLGLNLKKKKLTFIKRKEKGKLAMTNEVASEREKTRHTLFDPFGFRASSKSKDQSRRCENQFPLNRCGFYPQETTNPGIHDN